MIFFFLIPPTVYLVAVVARYGAGLTCRIVAKTLDDMGRKG